MLHCSNGFWAALTKKGPREGAPWPVSREWGRSDADGGDGCRDPEAKANDQGGDNPIEEPFELGETCEGHDTHTFELKLNPGGAGTFCYLNTVKITLI
jgi:hypothetical protein